MPRLSEAAATGDRRETLIAMRDRIAQTIDSTESGRDVAALTKRLMEVMEEIDSMPDPAADAASPLDRARRKARG